jgi:hypothetical protein
MQLHFGGVDPWMNLFSRSTTENEEAMQEKQIPTDIASPTSSFHFSLLKAHGPGLILILLPLTALTTIRVRAGTKNFCPIGFSM